MTRCFRDLCRQALATGGGLGLAALWVHALPELLSTALDERSTKLARNVNRAVIGVALAAAFILAWMNLAVGVIGTEDDRANLMCVGVLAIGIIGAIIAHSRQDGMARALFAMALAQAVVPAIATGRQVQSGSYQGKALPPGGRATLIWARENGAWHLAGWHLSPIPPGPEP